MPSQHLTTDRQLASIRSTLLTPAELWARVASRFLADDPGDSAAKMKRCRAASNTDKGLVLWKTREGWACLARTKSEARAIYKRTCGGVVPKGLDLKRAG